ncbi:hypothetical protein CORC01_03106 [Colletotrichum orchidophilum]|uniref:Uncharacterized protein n=1 Tax=Colletotrichum orchidophilum TaxID=1209926 RepID=A0A1G4BJX7_9PEZI|nr:uncharacterized protein CORC01_03106 [Colletotrichum orchidophilum]OHF01616.1 hypothetical protein CORC01_03106 [Colletotrichum orchidophilum]
MHLSAFIPFLAAALITPGMALPTQINGTFPAPTNQTFPAAMNANSSADSSSQDMTVTTTMCIHASLRGLCPALCLPVIVLGEHQHQDCLTGCYCRWNLPNPPPK